MQQGISNIMLKTDKDCFFSECRPNYTVSGCASADDLEKRVPHCVCIAATHVLVMRTSEPEVTGMAIREKMEQTMCRGTTCGDVTYG